MDKVASLAHSFSERRRVYKDETSLVDGWLYKETSVQGLLNRRYGAVYPSALATYRKQDASAMPTKTWRLDDGCLLSEVAKGEYMIRNKGVSSLWSMARGHYSKAVLYGFVIKFPPGHLHHKEPLKICFESEDTAREWQRHMARTIRGSAPDPLSRTTGDMLKGLTMREEEIHNDEDSRPIADLNHSSPQESGPSLLATKNLKSFTNTIKDSWEGTIPSTSTSGISHCSLRHVNGVAVHQESDSEGQGAFMISAKVSASPREVFCMLTGQDNGRPTAFDWELIERVDNHIRVIKLKFKPSRFAKAVCAPREAILQQSWREEEDGTIVVLGQSVEHKAAPPTSGWAWYTPVRAQVDAASFTLAPLQPQYRSSSGVSHSCLVTFVLKVDLGGYLSGQSMMGLLMQPLTQQVADMYLHPVLTAVIALRDTVEQSRYTVQPFTLAQESEEEAEPDEGEGGAPPLKSATSRQLKSMSSGLGRASHLGSRELPGKAARPGPAFGEALAEEESGGVEGAGVPEPDFGEAVSTMSEHATLPQQFWSCPGATGFHVRGPNYLKDHKKIAAEEPLFSLASCDFVQIGERPFHIARHLDSIKHSKAPFNFILNLMVPGPQKLALVVTWAAEQTPPVGRAPPSPDSPLQREGSSTTLHGDSDSEAGSAPFDLLLARFLAGDDSKADARRNSIFKLIPSVAKGSWVIKQSVGHTPVLLGKKLTTHYHRGPNYFEVDVDVSSSRAANSVVGMVQGATNSMIIDLAVVLEGHSEDELPECLLGTVRFTSLDMKAFKKLSIA